MMLQFTSIKFKQRDPCASNVDFKVILASQNDFRRSVEPGLHVFRDSLLFNEKGRAKVAQFDEL